MVVVMPDQRVSIEGYVLQPPDGLRASVAPYSYAVTGGHTVLPDVMPLPLDFVAVRQVEYKLVTGTPEPPRDGDSSGGDDVDGGSKGGVAGEGVDAGASEARLAQREGLPMAHSTSAHCHTSSRGTCMGLRTLVFARSRFLLPLFNLPPPWVCKTHPGGQIRGLEGGSSACDGSSHRGASRYDNNTPTSSGARDAVGGGDIPDGAASASQSHPTDRALLVTPAPATTASLGLSDVVGFALVGFGRRQATGWGSGGGGILRLESVGEGNAPCAGSGATRTGPPSSVSAGFSLVRSAYATLQTPLGTQRSAAPQPALNANGMVSPPLPPLYPQPRLLSFVRDTCR
jgi:hypothetical protein